MKDPYTENHKTLMKQTEDDTSKWKDIPCSRTGRINTVKMIIPSKVIYRFNAIPIKIPMTFFTELEQIILKFFIAGQKTLNSQNNLEKKEQSWRYNAPLFRSTLQNYSHQNSMVWHKNRHIHKWNRIESPEINQLLYDKKAIIYNWAKTASSIMVLRNLDSYMQKDQTELLSHTIYKTELKMD